MINDDDASTNFTYKVKAVVVIFSDGNLKGWVKFSINSFVDPLSANCFILNDARFFTETILQLVLNMHENFSQIKSSTSSDSKEIKAN